MGQVNNIQTTNDGKSFTYVNNGQSVDCVLKGNPSITQMAAEGERMLAANTLVSMKSSGGKRKSGKRMRKSNKKRSNKKRSVRRG